MDINSYGGGTNMSIFYDFIYSTSVIVGIILHVYLIIIAHRFIVQRRWPKWKA